ncbi:MAG: 16S rRNA processing protein RimM [Acidobacteria bacterium]|nr:16S rRNA processing protein RimM [Acidobacteriota bacterium]
MDRGEELADRWLPIARIGKPRGSRGEVTAGVILARPEAFAGLREVLVRGEEAERRLEVVRAHRYSEKVILRFRGVESWQEAGALRGALVLRRAREFVDDAGDAYYISELKGCRVELADGTLLGEVEDVIPTGGTDVLAVRAARGQILVPFSRSICVRIEPERKRIRVDPPDGLLDLDAV